MEADQTKNIVWRIIPFIDCLQKTKIVRAKQVKEKDYLNFGEYPIVDQGQSFIAGYTNDKAKVISDIQPFIIFGDHTRILKYVDFPIALGADGTKIIKPNRDFDTKFFFYFLKYLDIPSRGYNRHYKSLKEKDIIQPELIEQKAIARVLTNVQEAIAGQEELIAKLKDLKRSMMQHLFTHGTKGEKTKKTEIGEIPESWEVVSLGKICEFEYGKNLTKQNRVSGDVPVYGSNGVVGYHNQAIVALPGIIIGRKGSAGLLHFSEVAFCPIDTTFYITQNETELDIKFLFYLLERLDLTRLTADVGVPGLNREMAYREIIAYPKDANAQKEIINSVGGIEERIKAAKNKLASYQNLFKTLLHELMSGAKKVEI